MQKDSTTIIKPKSGWQFINIVELVKYKDLLYFMVLREIRVLYKQTALGFSWAIIRPVLSMVIFSIIFGKLANISSDGIPYPIFSYTALVPWIYFSTSMTKSTQSLIGSASIITKVYFPRLIIPFTPIVSGLVDFAIALSITFILMFYYGIAFNSNIIFLPLLVIIMMVASAGIGMWLSALSMQYRDVRHGITFLSQILMYAAPVAWPVSLLTAKFGEQITFLYGFYPMAGVIEGFRSSMLGTNPMPWEMILTGSITSILLFISGGLYFKRKEIFFADVA